MGCITYAIAGVPLDDSDGRWSLRKGTVVGLGASVRAVSTTVPGVHGTLSGGSEVFDEAALVLKMQVRGDSYSEMMAHWSALVSVLAPTDGVEVTRTVDGVSLSQVARGRTVDQPEFSPSRRTHTFTATLRLPQVFWRGPVSTWLSSTGSFGAGPVEVTTLAGSTAPVTDAEILIVGPCSQPRVSCGSSWFELGLTLAGGTNALIDCESWKVATGAGLTFGGSGTDRSGSLLTSGGPYVLPLVPSMAAADPVDTRVMVSLSAASGATSGSGVAIRGRSSHLG